MYNKYLAELSKEQLLELIELYAKNWLAHDGVWFQSIEGKFGRRRPYTMMRRRGSALPSSKPSASRNSSSCRRIPA